MLEFEKPKARAFGFYPLYAEAQVAMNYLVTQSGALQTNGVMLGSI